MRWWQTPLIVLLSPALIVLVAIVVSLHLLLSLGLHLIVWIWWCGRGRDVLLVYSNSPIWRDHMEQAVLPRLGQRATVLNWSERRRWRWSIARLVFEHFAGRRAFNPLAVVFRPFRRTKTFRFWGPFRELRRGRPQDLQKLEEDLFALIGTHDS
jgi:hypothetical protein